MCPRYTLLSLLIGRYSAVFSKFTVAEKPAIHNECAILGGTTRWGTNQSQHKLPEIQSHTEKHTSESKLEKTV